MIICALDLKEGLDKRKMEFVKRCKVWNVRDDITGIFRVKREATFIQVVEGA